MGPGFVKGYLRSLPLKRQRALFVFFAVLLGAAGVLVILNAFRDNIVYFYTPTELFFRHVPPHQPVRVGGLVEMGSVKREPQGTLGFVITDGGHRVRVEYKGVPPDLFREGQGVIAEGSLDESGTLLAGRILAKHDEKYMPREVVDRLKQSGYWRGGRAAPR